MERIEKFHIHVTTRALWILELTLNIPPSLCWRSSGDESRLWDGGQAEQQGSTPDVRCRSGRKEQHRFCLSDSQTWPVSIWSNFCDMNESLFRSVVRTLPPCFPLTGPWIWSMLWPMISTAPGTPWLVNAAPCSKDLRTRVASSISTWWVERLYMHFICNLSGSRSMYMSDYFIPGLYHELLEESGSPCWEADCRFPHIWQHIHSEEPSCPRGWSTYCRCWNSRKVHAGGWRARLLWGIPSYDHVTQYLCLVTEQIIV